LKKDQEKIKRESELTQQKLAKKERELQRENEELEGN